MSTLTRARMATGPGDHPVALLDLPALSPEQMLAQKRVCMYMPFVYLQNGGECLEDVTPLHTARQCAQLVYLMAKVVSEPWTCTETPKDGVKTPVIIEGERDENGYVIVNENSVATMRICVHLEVVMRANGASPLGLRFWIDVQDRKVDLNRGILCVIADNEADAVARKYRMGTPRPPRVCDAHKRLKTQEQWVRLFVATQRTVNTLKALATPITDPSNPANIYKCMDPEFAFQLTAAAPAGGVDACDPQQRDLAAYSGVDDDGKRRYVFPCPERVYHLGLDNFTPSTLFACKFPYAKGRGDASGAARSMRMSAEQRLVESVMAQHAAVTAPPPADTGNGAELDVVDKLAATNRARVRAFERAPGTTATQRMAMHRAWVRSTGAIEEAERVLYGGQACDKVVQTVQWIRKLEDEAAHAQLAAVGEGLPPPPGFSMMSPPRPPIDAALSPFGNLAAYFLNDCEVYYGVRNLHSTTYLMYLAAMGPYRCAMEMNSHMVLSGAAAVGKSFVGWLLRHHLLPPHMIELATRQTKRANETSNNASKKHCAYYSDELSDEFLGIDANGRMKGTGDPMMKAAMSDCVLVTWEPRRAEDGSRNMVKCVSIMLCNFMGNTNNDKGALPAPIRSRVHVRNCTEQDRPNHGLPELEYSRARRENAAMNALAEKPGRAECDLRYQKTSCLLMLAEQLIHLCLVREPSMLVANVVSMKFYGYLASKGVDLGGAQRHMQRVRNFLRTQCLVKAVDAVFNTTKYFAPNKPFELRDLLRLQDYLLVTEEEAIFVNQLLIENFIDVENAQYVLALVAHECRYVVGGAEGGDGATAETVFQAGDPTADWNYLQVDRIWPDRALGLDQTTALALRMFKCMNKGVVSTSRENLTGILRDLLDGTMVAVPYTGMNERAPEGDAAARKFRHLILDAKDGHAYVSRHYVDWIASEDYESIAFRAAEAYEHEHIAARRIVCGATYGSRPRTWVGARRDEKYVIAPHMWKCMDLVPNPRRPLTVPNAHAADMADGDADYQPSVYVATDDLEVDEFKRWVRFCCYQPDELETVLDAMPSATRARLAAQAGPRQRVNVYPGVLRQEYADAENLTAAKLAGTAPIDEARDAFGVDIFDAGDGLDEMVSAKRARLDVGGAARRGVVGGAAPVAAPPSPPPRRHRGRARTPPPRQRRAHVPEDDDPMDEGEGQ